MSDAQGGGDATDVIQHVSPRIRDKLEERMSAPPESGIPVESQSNRFSHAIHDGRSTMSADATSNHSSGRAGNPSPDPNRRRKGTPKRYTQSQRKRLAPARREEEREDSSPAKRAFHHRSPGNSRNATDRKPGSPADQHRQSQITGYLTGGERRPAKQAAPGAASPAPSADAPELPATPAAPAPDPKRTSSAAGAGGAAGHVPSPPRARRGAAGAVAIAPAPAAAGPSVEALAALQHSCSLAEQRLAHERARSEAAEKVGVEARAQLERLQERTRGELETLLRASAGEEARARRMRTAEEEQEIGRIAYVRRAPHMPPHEVWEDGMAFHELSARREGVKRERERLEKRKREIARASRTRAKLRKQREEHAAAPADASMLPPSLPASVCDGEDTGDVTGFGPVFQSPAALRDAALACAWDDIAEAQEWIAVQLQNLRRQEQELDEEQRRLDSRKALLVRELRRQADERDSRFSKRPLLAQRYLLLKLLGRGGFSEVWHAYDVQDLKHVACKVHQLNPAWSEERKANYTRHATREYAIHKALNHPRIVRLFNVFEIDQDSFATVLEFCRGTDLDHYLKERKQLAEREARAILLQIMSALHFLSTEGAEAVTRSAGGAAHGMRRSIIHYDLKPANILFDEHGEVKMTDFGLSKIHEDDGRGSGIELTSQGAGTYWYLPPECFVVGSTPPKISSKVDVWSVGVIFFQMLYGARPFGEGQSQDAILADRTILNAKEVHFPPKPPVSDEAKAFMRRCLTHDQDHRPDVNELCRDPYFAGKPKARR